MNNKVLLFLFIFTCIANILTAKAQDSTNVFGSDFNKVKPIVQVFCIADYNVSDNNYGFGIGRVHLGFKYQYNKNWSAKIILDRGRPTTLGQISVTDTSGNQLNVSNLSKEGSFYTMTLKFATLEWKVNNFIKIQAGGILQNHYITQERFWGYRYVAQTFQDRYYNTPSRDLGFIAYFKPNDKIGFDIALTNGEGFRFNQDKYGNVKLAGGIDFNLTKGMQTRVFYDRTTSDNPDKPATQELYSVFAGYKFKKLFRIGAEYNYHKNHNNIENENLYGYSVYGSIALNNKTELFTRFDKLISNTKSGDNQNWHFIEDGQAVISGIQYGFVNGVNVSLNYRLWLPYNSNSDLQHNILFNFEFKI